MYFDFPGKIAKALEGRKFFIILILFLIFAVYRIVRYTGFLGQISWLDAPGIFSPGILDILWFSLTVVFFFFAYRFSPDLEERNRVVLIFFASFFLIAGFTQLSQPVWVDSQGFYDLGVLGVEEGPLYLVQNYHTLNTRWDQENLDLIEGELRAFGIYEFGKEKLGLEVGEQNQYASRTSQHPPVWPLVLSFFMTIFGISETSALVATWIVLSLAIVAVYFVLKKLAGETAATRLAFLFAVLPVILLSNNSPLSEGLVILFVALSLFFLVSKDGRFLDYLISGLFLALAFYTKFTIALLFPLFFIILLLREGFRESVKRFLVFIIPSVIITILFMAMNYFFFLTLITAKATMTIRLTIAVKNAFLSAFVLPGYYLVYFSIPLIFLIGVIFLGLVSKKRGGIQLVLFLSLLAFMFLYPNKLGLERYALPYFLVVFVFFSKDIGKFLDDHEFFVFILILTLIQSVLYLV